MSIPASRMKTKERKRYTAEFSLHGGATAAGTRFCSARCSMLRLRLTHSTPAYGDLDRRPVGGGWGGAGAALQGCAGGFTEEKARIQSAGSGLGYEEMLQQVCMSDSGCAGALIQRSRPHPGDAEVPIPVCMGESGRAETCIQVCMADSGCGETCIQVCMTGSGHQELSIQRCMHEWGYKKWPIQRCMKDSECASVAQQRAKGPARCQPRATPWVKDGKTSKPQRGATITNRISAAPLGLVAFYGILPRAALVPRFALGWHLAGPLALTALPDKLAPAFELRRHTFSPDKPNNQHARLKQTL